MIAACPVLAVTPMHPVASVRRFLKWDAHHPDPQHWPLVFTDIDKLDRGFYDGTVTEYLVEWLTGRFHPIPLWDLQ